MNLSEMATKEPLLLYITVLSLVFKDIISPLIELNIINSVLIESIVVSLVITTLLITYYYLKNFSSASLSSTVILSAATLFSGLPPIGMIVAYKVYTIPTISSVRDDTEELLQQGEDYIQNGVYEKALFTLEEALNKINGKISVMTSLM